MNLHEIKNSMKQAIFVGTHPFQLRDVENNETSRHSLPSQAKRHAFDLAYEHLIACRDEGEGTVSDSDAARKYVITVFKLPVWSCEAQHLWPGKVELGTAP